MANKYWIGNSGNWGDASHWSLSSGGTWNAGIPTSSDNVHFDASSFDASGSIYVNINASCRDIDFSNIDNSVWFISSVYPFSIYGDISLNSQLNWKFSGTGYTYIKPSPGYTINYYDNSCYAGMNSLYIDGSGGTFKIMNDCSINAAAYLKYGKWDFNKNNVYISGAFRADSAGITYLNVIDASFTIGSYAYIILTTFNASVAGSTINIYGNSCQWFTNYGGGTINGSLNIVNLFYISSGAPVSIIIPNVNTLNIYGNSFGFGASRTHNVDNLYIYGPPTSNVSTNRTLLCSDTFGVPATINTSYVYSKNTDFRDISAGGPFNWNLSAADGFSGDCQGNYGIIFTPSVSCYFVSNTSMNNIWGDTDKWRTTSGGSTYTRVPLPQDNAIFDASSLIAGVNTLNLNNIRYGNINMSAINSSLAISSSNTLEFYQNLILSDKISSYYTSSYYSSMAGRNDNIINLNFNPNTYINGYFSIISPNKITLNSNIKASGYFYVTNGTLDTSGYNIETPRFYLPTSAKAYLRNSTLLSNQAGTSEAIDVPGTIYDNSHTIIIRPNGYTANIPKFLGYGHNFNNLILDGSKGVNISIGGDNRFNTLQINPGITAQITANTTQNVSTFIAIGRRDASIGLRSLTLGSKYTLKYAGKDYADGDYIYISDSSATLYGTWYDGDHSVDVSNNTGWIWSDRLKHPLMYNGYILDILL